MYTGVGQGDSGEPAKASQNGSGCGDTSEQAIAATDAEIGIDNSAHESRGVTSFLASTRAM